MGTRVGELLASKYRLEELLGSGGMGHVYRAVNEDVGRAVAIKVLRSEHAANEPIVDRFLREARAANLVRHPNVVDVLDVGRDTDGSPFIVQELLKGEDLQKYVERRGGKLTLDEIESLYLPVIDAVAEAHARGVVHRDIKPENVFLSEEGNRRVPKLLDFGISKIRQPNIRATEVGVMMGTPAYMAPEQIQGAGETDPRSDVWALGIMLFELLSGRYPFQAADAPSLFVAVITQDAPSVLDYAPQVDPAIALLVTRCLRRNPNERYPSALELARDFRHVLDGVDIEPTQRFSLRPKRPPPDQLDIPELDMPPVRIPAPPAAPTLSGPSSPTTPRGEGPSPLPPGREGWQQHTELARGQASSPSSTLALELRSSPSARTAIPELDRSLPSSATMKAGAQNLAATERGMSPAPPQPLSGMMFGGTSATSARRPAPPPIGYERPIDAPDVAGLVGVGVVGLTAIGTSAVLMTFAHQPEGFSILALVTKPTPTLSLVVQGGLAVLGIVLAGVFVANGIKSWRFFAGARPRALGQAAIAGALFFAAIELARAAW